MNKCICIIPIRSKSKGIVNKNIKKLAGMPLVLYAIKSAVLSKVFQSIIVATDSSNYINYIKNQIKNKKINSKKIEYYKRSLKSAKDFAPTELVITEILKKIKNIDIIYLIQATSPFLQSQDIKNSFYKFKKNKFDSMFSCCQFKKFIWSNSKKIKPINYNYSKRPMRQHVKNSYMENGAFYIFKKKGFDKYKNRLFGKIGFFNMPIERSIDIDVDHDFKLANYFINKKLLNTK